MERYKVYYWRGVDDYSVVYAHNEEEAEQVFRKYNPHREPLKVTAFPNLPGLTALYEQLGFEDEHEYLLAVIEAVQDAGVEEKVAEFLLAKGWDS